jgi:GTP-binding protein
VTIGEMTFDFEPSAGIDDSYVPTRRGTDERFENSSRPRADQRLAAKKARRAQDQYDGEWVEDDADRDER